MTSIQRYDAWPQEWPFEAEDGDLVTYEDHRKIVEELEAKLAKAVEELEDMQKVPKSDASYGILQVMIKYALASASTALNVKKMAATLRCLRRKCDETSIDY